jgi:hypothetical protein
MDNNVNLTAEEHNIKVSEGKVEIVYTNPGAGCMVSSALFGTLLSIFVIFVVAPDTGIVRGIFGVIIGMMGLIFSGAILIKLIGVIVTGRTLFTVENGVLSGRKESMPISDIKDIKWGGKSFKYLSVQSVNNKKIKLSTYNLVNEDKVHKVIDQYVVQRGKQELKENWKRRYGSQNFAP